MFEEKKPLKEIIDEMRKELAEEKNTVPDPFEQLFGKKKIELATFTKKKQKKRDKKAKKKAQRKKTGEKRKKQAKSKKRKNTKKR